MVEAYGGGGNEAHAAKLAIPYLPSAGTGNQRIGIVCQPEPQSLPEYNSRRCRLVFRWNSFTAVSCCPNNGSGNRCSSFQAIYHIVAKIRPTSPVSARLSTARKKNSALSVLKVCNSALTALTLFLQLPIQR